MIVDSHAHYSHKCFENTFRYLAATPEGYTIQEGTRERMRQAMTAAGIVCTIEPGISLGSNDALLRYCRDPENRAFPAVGVHPTRTFREKWRDRKRLEDLVRTPGVIAVGETGLDYHHARKDQHRLCQMGWFLYQLNLSQKYHLPLILHIRDADADAIRILRLHPARKNGGVVHCFNRGWQEARQYLEMGFHIGIGGSLLQRGEGIGALEEAIRNAPLERILVETDSPYVLPDCKDTIRPKLLRRTRNSSLILPEVIERIAQLKAVEPRQVELATAQNAIRLFSLPLTPDA